MNEKKRYVNLLPQYISPDKSQVSILYEQNIIQTDTSKIYLRIKLKDNYNRDIPVVTLNQLNCDFSESEVILKIESSSTNRYSVESEYKNDYVILSVNKPSFFHALSGIRYLLTIQIVFSVQYHILLVLLFLLNLQQE